MRQLLIAAAAVLLLVSSARADLKIVTTTTDFADLARQIGRDRVEVHSVMKGPENVHNVLAKPTEMLALNRADMFVHAGLDAEPWRDNLMKGARNPKIMSGQPGNVDMSRGIELLDPPEGRVTRAQGDVHAYGNPHYQLSPKNAQKMAATLANAQNVSPDRHRVVENEPAAHWEAPCKARAPSARSLASEGWRRLLRRDDAQPQPGSRPSRVASALYMVDWPQWKYGVLALIIGYWR